MVVTFEWVAQERDEHGDIIHLEHYPSRSEVEAHQRLHDGCSSVLISLVREEVDAEGNLLDRQYAHMADDGTLPAALDGGARIPAFYRQVQVRR